MTATAMFRSGHGAAQGGPGGPEARPRRTGGRDPRDRVQIASVRQQIERHFLRVGNNLESLSAGLAALDAPLQTLSQMQGPAWAALGTRLAELDGEFDALEAAFAQYARLIGAIVETAGALAPEIAQVARTVRTMKIVALNARVAASTIATRDAGLEVFTETAGALIETADGTTRAVADQIGRILDTTRKTFDATYARGWDELSRARGAIATIRDFVTDAAAPDGGRQDFGQGLQTRLHRLRTRLADAAMAMQAGDRARQRLEHVAVLQDGDFGLDRVWTEALAADLLRGAATDFGRDAGDIDRIMADILGLSHTLAGGVGAGSGLIDAAETEKTLGAVLAMRGSLSVLHDVRTVFSDLVASLTDDFERFDHALRRIGEIEGQMHIVGVNAVITCSRLGAEGAALKEVANQLAALSAEVAVRFGGVRDRISVVDGQFRALSGDLSQRPRALIEAMELSSTSLLEQLRDVFAKWERLRQEMGAVQAQLDARIPGDLDAIAGLARRLRSVAVQSDRLAAPSGAPPDPEDLSRVHAQYSMDSERDIHRAFLARHGLADASAGAVSAPGPAATAQDLDDILF